MCKKVLLGSFSDEVTLTKDGAGLGPDPFTAESNNWEA